MRIVIQRVSEASVIINGTLKSSIERGMLILLGIEHEDTRDDADWLIQKIKGIRIFSDNEGKMNLSAEEIQGRYLVVSQFTLHASTKKGNRPGYSRVARPETAVPLYDYFLKSLASVTETVVESGEFGADMKVSLTNDGPVTILMDSKNRE